MFEDLIVEKQEVDEWKICPSCGAGKDIEVYPRVRTFANLLLYMHCPKCNHRWTINV
jgi:rubredoxin